MTTLLDVPFQLGEPQTHRSITLAPLFPQCGRRSAGRQKTPPGQRWCLNAVRPPVSRFLIPLIAVILMLFASPRTAAAEAQPNVVVILTDDMSTWDLARMPDVQRLLVDSGVTYTDYVDNNPLCAPSRASLLTGLTSPHDGVWGNSAKHGGYTAFAAGGYPTEDLPVWMQEAGYETSIDGKYINGFTSSDPVPAGWDDSHILFLADAADESVKGGYYNYATLDNGTVTHHGSSPEDYSTSVLGQDAVNFIDGADPGRPLFMWYAPHAPHQPATPAPQYLNAAECRVKSPRTPDYDALGSDPPAWALLLPAVNPAADDRLAARRCGALLSVDDEVGRIVQALTDTGRLSDTLIVFASDNGFSLGQHDWLGKIVPYQESDRMPLVVRWDDDPMLEPGSVSDGLVENTDVPVAISDAALARMPLSDGDDFLQSAVREVAPIAHAVDRTRFVPVYCGVVTAGGLQYVQYADGSQELYDLEADPFELDNLIGSVDVSGLRGETFAGCTPRPPGWKARFG